VAAQTASIFRRGLALETAGLLAISLVLTRGPLPGHARGPEVAIDSAPLIERDRASAPVAPPPIHPAESRIVAGTFYSQAMQTQRSFDIYLPPSYEQSADRTYPVLYLLHGDGGRVGDWVALGLRAKMDQSIAGGAPEMLVAMPDGSGHFGDLTDWANRWNGTDPVEDQVTDLVSFVDQSYRTIPDRSTRFIGGLSSGGFGSLNLALHHPDLFSTAMSFSGFIAAKDREADPGVFGDNPAYVDRNSPAALVTSQAGAGDIYYVLSGGQQDAYFKHRMAEFSAQLDRLGIAHEFHVVPGGHDGTAWDAGLDFGLVHLAAATRNTLISMRKNPQPQ
jgi:enterochelin esterase-like enzyme